MARVCVFLVLGLVACATCSTITEQSDHGTLSTPQLEASFVRKGDVSGVQDGGFLDEATGATVSLSVGGNKTSEARVDEVGDFSIDDVPSGIYDVTVIIGSMEAVIKGIEV